MCNGDIKPNKSTNIDPLAKWELKDEKALALINSSVNDVMFIYIENSLDTCSAWNVFIDLFDYICKFKTTDKKSQR